MSVETLQISALHYWGGCAPQAPLHPNPTPHHHPRTATFFDLVSKTQFFSYKRESILRSKFTIFFGSSIPHNSSDFATFCVLLWGRHDYAVKSFFSMPFVSVLQKCVKLLAHRPGFCCCFHRHCITKGTPSPSCFLASSNLQCHFPPSTQFLSFVCLFSCFH